MMYDWSQGEGRGGGGEDRRGEGRGEEERGGERREEGERRGGEERGGEERGGEGRWLVMSAIVTSKALAKTTICLSAVYCACDAGSPINVCQ